MKKNMKKVFAAGLAATMVMSVSVPVFADTVAKDNQDASFSKTYIETNENTASPEETFTFSFEKDHITDSNSNLSVSDMPEIPDSKVTFDLGQAATEDGTIKSVAVALEDIEWPGVGVYYYKVTEEAGNTAGVTYDDTTAYLKVTVAYDKGTDTYYTAFVTLNLADEDGDGITDSKVAGFKNEYSAGTLAIEKEVTGNLGDIEKYFDVTVTFEAPYTIVDGEKVYEVVMSDIYHNDAGKFDADDAKIWLSGNWTGVKSTDIKIKHGETYEFYNIPYGVTYTVKEADYTGEANGAYDRPDYTGEVVETVDETENGKPIKIEDKVSGTINAAGFTDEVKIVNNKGVVVDTGISLDNMPYIMMLAMAALGTLGFVSKKRKEEEMF